MQKNKIRNILSGKEITNAKEVNNELLNCSLRFDSNLTLQVY